LQAALRIDPGYARALAALADTYNLLGWYRVQSPAATFPKAIESASQALVLNPNLAEAHTSLGFANTFYGWDWSAAEERFLRAAELNPSYPTTHHWFAELLMARGRFEEAVREAEAAQRLDPLAMINNVLVAMAHYMAGDAERAAAESHRILELDPEFVPAYLWLARANVHLGRYDEAIEACRREMALATEPPSTTVHLLGMAHGLAGRMTEARQVLAALEQDAAERYVDQADLALVHLGLGDREAALGCLELAVLERSSQVPFLAVEPLLAPLRAEPRVQHLLRQVALVP
jgi:serine/threonine-protein kinase